MQEPPQRPKTIVQSYRERSKNKASIGFDTLLGKDVEQYDPVNMRKNVLDRSIIHASPKKTESFTPVINP